LDGDTFATGGADGSTGRLGCFGLDSIVYSDVCPGFGEREGDGFADASACAGD
jgi:hypothetical protein